MILCPAADPMTLSPLILSQKSLKNSAAEGFFRGAVVFIFYFYPSKSPASPSIPAR